MLNESDVTNGDWVRAADVLTNFSAIRSFISGDGLPRINADYWYNAFTRNVRGVIHFGPDSEGMPGYVHGGAISGVFDEAVGLLSWYLGLPVVTRELLVRFRQFVPINSTVQIKGHHGNAQGCHSIGSLRIPLRKSLESPKESLDHECFTVRKNAKRAAYAPVYEWHHALQTRPLVRRT
jgi:hypothetical protein